MSYIHQLKLGRLVTISKFACTCVCVYTRVVTCTASSRCIAGGYARAKMNNGLEE